MAGLIAAGLFTLALSHGPGLDVACKPSEITEAEARQLALDAAVTEIDKKWRIEGEWSNSPYDDPDTWVFKVRVTNNYIAGTSSLVGWFAVDKRTAELAGPVADPDNPVPYKIPAVAQEQERLRAEHCLG